MDFRAIGRFFPSPPRAVESGGWIDETVATLGLTTSRAPIWGNPEVAAAAALSVDTRGSVSHLWWTISASFQLTQDENFFYYLCLLLKNSSFAFFESWRIESFDISQGTNCCIRT